MDTVVWLIMALFACVGFVQTLTWLAVRWSSKAGMVYRVIPIGGPGKDPDRQLAMMFTCLQWESNPAKQIYVLYDAGMDENSARDCMQLVQDTGAVFIRTPEELGKLLKQA